MSKALELFIKLSEAKSTVFNAVQCRSRPNSSFRTQELYSTLDLTNTKHDLGMLIIKSTYLNNDNASRDRLFDKIKYQCEIAGINQHGTTAFIIFNMLINKPLSPQYKKIKSLYKKFANGAKIINLAQAKNKRTLKKLYENPDSTDNIYQIKQLNIAIQHLKVKLDDYADAKAKNTNLCPKCSGEGCNICSAGYITATMEDALKLFVTLGIELTTNDFSKLYWEPILSIVNDLQIQKSNAIEQMEIERKKSWI